MKSEKSARTPTPPGSWRETVGAPPAGLEEAARVALHDVMRIKAKERVLIATNPVKESFTISAALADAAMAAGADTTLIVQPRRTSLDMASDAVIHALRSGPDVVISISAEKMGKDRFGLVKPYRYPGVKGSWTHIFDALKGAKKARAFWSPGVTLDSFVRTVPIDYALLQRRAVALKRVFDPGDRIHITAAGGTDLEVGIHGRKTHADDGLFHKVGSGGNLPAGEVYISPALNDAEGIMVFDVSVSIVGGTIVPDVPVRVTVKNGLVVKVEGGEAAHRLEDSLLAGEKMAHGMTGKKGWTPKKVASYARNAHHLGEVGIGLNPQARVTGNMLEDEKILGTCHIAIGSNYDDDAEALIHLDCIIQSPTITVMGRGGKRTVVMEEGRLL